MKIVCQEKYGGNMLKVKWVQRMATLIIFFFQNIDNDERRMNGILAFK